MVGYVPSATGTPGERRAARGDHRWVFAEGDCAPQLAQCQPLMVWGSHGGAPTLPYGDFARLLLNILLPRAGDAGATDKFELCGMTEEDADRSWRAAVLLMQPADWEPCTFGTLAGRLRARTRALGVNRTPFVMTMAYAHEPVEAADAAPFVGASAPAAGEDGARFVPPGWFNFFTFGDGGLCRGGDDLLLAGLLVYYCETLALAATRRCGGQYEVTITQLARAAGRAAEQEGIASDTLLRMRPAPKARMVLDYLTTLELPACLDVYTPPGPARELDFHDRVRYAAAGGAGKVAATVVRKRIGAVISAHLPLRHLHAGYSSPLELTAQQERVHRMFGLPEPELMLLGSIGTASRRLANLIDYVQSQEMVDAGHEGRVTLLEARVTGGAPLARPLASGARDDAALDDRTRVQAGVKLDARALERVRGSAAYIDLRRDAQAYVHANRPNEAVQCMLMGRPLVEASVDAAGNVVPAVAGHAPLALLHMYLFRSKMETEFVDPDFEDVAGLRTRLPTYFGAVVNHAMGLTGNLALPAVALAFTTADTWKETPFDIFNSAWLPALRKKHGAAPIVAIALENLYADWCTLLVTRDIFIALFTAVAVPDVTSTDERQPKSPRDVIDAVTDLFSIHGIIPALRPRIGQESRKLLIGCMAEWGARYHRVTQLKRDAATSVALDFVQYPCQAVADFFDFKDSCEDLAERRRAQLLESPLEASIEVAFGAAPAPATRRDDDGAGHKRARQAMVDTLLKQLDSASLLKYAAPALARRACGRAR